MTEPSPPADTPVTSVPPTLVRTFLIADVRGYTRFTLEQGDEAAARLASTFAANTRDVVAHNGGDVIELRGDEALAVFTSSRDALRAAVALQQRYAEEGQRDPTIPLPVGIGLDVGEAIPVEGGYRGAALNLAARLCSLAGQGEVLASGAVTHIARKLAGLAFVARGTAQLKGFAEPVEIFRIEPTDAPYLQADTPTNSDGIGASAPKAVQTLPIGGFLGALPDGEMVARSDEISRILALVDGVVDTKGRLIMLTGEPGVGKTRVAQEVTLEARNRGFLIGAGSCYEARQSSAYYPFLDVLGTLYAVASPEIRRSVDEQWPYLAKLVLAAEGSAHTSIDSPEDGDRLFWAVTAFVQAVSTTAPVAILLDDLHWSDAASLDLVHHLARHTRGNRVLLLATYRNVEVGRQHPLEGTLRELGRQGLIERVMLQRLDEEGIRDLAQQVLQSGEVSEEFVTALRERTEGNPYFVQQVVRDLVERGEVYRENDRWARKSIDELTVPESVRSVIGQRLTRLDTDVQEILRDASVLGQTFLFDELAAMEDRREENLESALESAGQAGLVREMAGDRYSFDHALTQQTLYRELTARRRRKLHLAAGEAIQATLARKRHADSSQVQAELAWHFQRADDTERALLHTLAAGHAAEAVYAHADAIGHFRTAVELAGDIGAANEEMEARESLGNALRLAGHAEAALAAFESLAEQQRARGDYDGLLRALSPLPDIARAVGMAHVHTVAEQFEGALTAVDRASIGTQARFRIGLARLRWLTGDYPGAHREALEAMDLAQGSGDQSIELLALRALSLTQWANGMDSVPTLQLTVERAAEAGESEREAGAWIDLAIGHIDAGRYVESRAADERALQLYRRIGSPGGMLHVLNNMWIWAWIGGRWDDIERLLDETRAVAVRLDEPGLAKDIEGRRAALHLWRGDRSTEARVARSMTDVAGSHLVTGLLGEWALFDGRPQDVLDHLALRDREISAQHRGEYIGLRAAAHLALGDLDLAEKLVSDAVNAPDRGGLIWYRLRFFRVLGAVRARQNRHEEAETLLQKAVLEAGDLWFLRAQSLYDLGMAYVDAGKQDRATLTLEEALALLMRTGATMAAERTRCKLDDLASGMAQSPGS